MSTYRMTPARAEALRKAQLASARNRRRIGNRTRTTRRQSRKALIVAGTVAAGGVAIGGVVAANKVSEYRWENRNRPLIKNHVKLARYQNWYLNEFIAPLNFSRPFNEDAAKREAIETLKRKKKT